jgi:hypothetical protein
MSFDEALQVASRDERFMAAPRYRKQKAERAAK